MAQSAATVNDVQIELLPIVPPMPGFDSKYRLVYRNFGNVAQTGTITFSFEGDKMDVVSIGVAPDAQTSNSLTWNYSNLLPLYGGTIDITVNINSPQETPAVNLDDHLMFIGTVTGTGNEVSVADNVYNLTVTVAGSFDPNDKTCLEGSTIAPSEVGKYVNYLIRFESTGTANAQNIVVEDIIDTTKFDINSLIPVSGSNNFQTRISENKVEFIFENINLPFDDANNDGFVAFKIKTKPTLVLGDTFSNTASIYFDYNHPIVTEPAITTISTLSAKDFEFSDHFSVYPNPVGNMLNIQSKDNMELSSLRIYNTLGQLVLTIPNANQIESIDVSRLKAGNYFLNVTSDLGNATMKFIKK